MLALVVDSAGLELTPLVVDITPAGDSLRFVCTLVEKEAERSSRPVESGTQRCQSPDEDQLLPVFCLETPEGIQWQVQETRISIKVSLFN